MKKLWICISIFALLGIKTSLNAQQANNSISTENGDLEIHPLHHGTLALTWNDHTIYVDPTGGAEAFEKLDTPDLVLITHLHGDHFDLATLEALNTEETTIIVPASVAQELPEDVGNEQIILENGEDTEIAEVNISAIPMYNLPEEGARHPKGWGNGYILTMGGTRTYISGDTEGIPEMRSLQDIDLAFVCMNLPYTMDVEQAADAVLDFKPVIIYPYHYRGQDTEKFKDLVNEGSNNIEVRLRNWYK